MFKKNDDFDTDEMFTGTLDRMFAHIPKNDIMDREYEITTEEMEEVMNSMNPHKAPGPDGMKMGMIYVGGTQFMEALRTIMEEMWRDSFMPQC